MKKTICIIIACISIICCKTQSNIVTSKKEAKNKGIYSYDENQNIVILNTSKANKTHNYSSNSLPSKVIATAKENLGVNYKTGGTTKSGMDCSGLVYSTFNTYKIKLPRSSFEMAEEGMEVSKRNAQPGDLIFFKTNNSRVINHVGIITNTDNNVITFIHSSTSKGVIESTLLDNYYATTFQKINRIIE